MYIIIGAAFIAGIVISVAVVIAAFRTNNAHRLKWRKLTKEPQKKHKIEFVKIIVFFVILTYFVGVYVGIKVTLIDFSQLGVLLAFIGTPTAATIGFYCWKAKAENIIKIKKNNPEETAGIPVDLNNINA